MVKNVMSEDAAERMNRMIRNGLTQRLALAVCREEMTETNAFKEQAQNERACNLSKTVEAEWPKIDVLWDICPERYHRSLDGVNATKFRQCFPVVEVVGTNAEDLHTNLDSTSQRVNNVFHSDYIAKTARLVAYLECGGAVTPPFVRHVNGGLYLAGGHHRFGWARHCRQSKLPILIVSEEKPVIEVELSLSCWP